MNIEPYKCAGLLMVRESKNEGKSDMVNFSVSWLHSCMRHNKKKVLYNRKKTLRNT